MDHSPPIVIVGAPPFGGPDAEQLVAVDLDRVMVLDHEPGGVPCRSARWGPFSA